MIYGVTLEHGRRRAMSALAPRAGESILEIGVGTGLSAVEYPPGCRIVEHVNVPRVSSVVVCRST